MWRKVQTVASYGNGQVIKDLKAAMTDYTKSNDTVSTLL